MRDLDGRRMRTRIKGRDALVKSLRLLLIRASRFSRFRASADDHHFAHRLIDGLAATLHAIDELEK